ncbi:hypothetical protein DFH11DRAFT_1549679 [Phellopilus nigrolimitatus]|nr:hypothetical protein DFH11DRAFT_1549679 [Phellopilus nigrolimitatus]
MTCHINRLAPELLCMIFSACIERHAGHYAAASPTKAPLVFLRVCKRWRALALRAPELWSSLALRRRVGPPHGFDFARDAHALQRWLARARGRPAAVQLAYGDIKRYGNVLMWAPLVHTARALLAPGPGAPPLARAHLALPDDCMERVLAALAAAPPRHAGLRALALRSSREGVLRARYAAYWRADAAAPHYPLYTHALDLAGLPALAELSVHFPGPLRFAGSYAGVRTLRVALFSWDQFDAYLRACPAVEHLALELPEALLGRPSVELDDSDVVRLARVRTLDLHSALSAPNGGTFALACLFLRLRVPRLAVLRVRRVARDDAVPFLPMLGLLLERTELTLERFEMYDFPLDARITRSVLPLLPELRHLAYRDARTGAPPGLLSAFLGTLAWNGTDDAPPLPRLETLELDAPEMRAGRTRFALELLRVVSSRAAYADAVDAMASTNNNAKRAPRVRELRLPAAYLHVMRRTDTRGVLRGVRLERTDGAEDMYEEDCNLDDGDDSHAMALLAGRRRARGVVGGWAPSRETWDSAGASSVGAAQFASLLEVEAMTQTAEEGSMEF